ALRGDLDRLDARAIQREDALDAGAEAHLAHREGRARAGAVALDDHALEYLDAGLVAFDDLVVHLDGVAAAKLGNVAANLALFEVVNDWALHGRAPRKSGGELCTLQTQSQSA